MTCVKDEDGERRVVRRVGVEIWREEKRREKRRDIHTHTEREREKEKSVREAERKCLAGDRAVTRCGLISILPGMHSLSFTPVTLLCIPFPPPAK